MNDTTLAAVPAGSPAAAPALPRAAEDRGEFRRGWRILLLGLLGVATSVTAALLYAFGVFVIPLQQEFDWPRGSVQATLSFLSAGGMVAVLTIGWINHRFGARNVTLASLVLLALGYLALVLLPVGADIAWLYAIVALLPIVSMGNMPVTWTQIVANWFVRHRGLALAIVLCGTGVGGAMLPVLLTWTIQQWGWRAGFAVMALPLVVVMVPLTLMWFRDAPPATDAAAAAAAAQRARQGITYRQGLVSGRFWLYTLALSFVVSAVIAMLTSAIPLMRDKGYSPLQASQIFATYGFTLIVGRLVVGWLLDHLWAPGVAAVTMALPALGCLILGSAEPPTILLMVALGLIGMGAGAEFDLSSYLFARYFGMRDYGRLYGLHLTCVNLFGVGTPLLVRWLYGAAGDYSLLLIYCEIAFVVGGLSLLLLGRAPRWDEQAVPQA